mmetsp:Transcript_104661/g.262259  ORF Transcript_104661/g.262259 Transcript_104661/m.262259 type:complete len:279 (+) Transcript_104661:105-941(+)
MEEGYFDTLYSAGGVGGGGGVGGFSRPLRTASRKVQPIADEFSEDEFGSSDKQTSHGQSPRSRIGTACYLRPTSSPKGRRPSTGAGSRISASPHSRLHGGDFKTERWREHGLLRWPAMAKEHVQKQPYQFSKSEEIVPLQRTTENPQNGIAGELWTRSLRVGALRRDHIAKVNKNIATCNLATTFDGSGVGWSGSTNCRKQVERPSSREWVDRPVAVGSMGLDHMGGSRYEMRPTPRECVPGSMAHAGFRAPGSARGTSQRQAGAPIATAASGALTAR